MGVEVDPELSHAKFVDLQDVLPAPIETFTSIRGAWEILRQIRWAWLAQVYRRHDEHAQFTERLRQWRNAFAKFRSAEEHSFSARDRRIAALLEMERRLFQLVQMNAADSRHYLSPCWWDDDDKLVMMDELVDNAAIAVTAPEGAVDSAPVFALEGGINIAVYTVAANCRDPRIRRKAIAVLHGAIRQEGAWNGRFAAELARMMMLREERGPGVPRHPGGGPRQGDGRGLSDRRCDGQTALTLFPRARPAPNVPSVAGRYRLTIGRDETGPASHHSGDRRVFGIEVCDSISST